MLPLSENPGTSNCFLKEKGSHEDEIYQRANLCKALAKTYFEEHGDFKKAIGILRSFCNELKEDKKSNPRIYVDIISQMIRIYVTEVMKGSQETEVCERANLNKELAEIYFKEFSNINKATGILISFCRELDKESNPEIYKDIIDQMIYMYAKVGKISQIIQLLKSNLEEIEGNDIFQVHKKEWLDLLETYSENDFIVDHKKFKIKLPKGSFFEADKLLKKAYAKIDRPVFTLIDGFGPGKLLFYYKNENGEIKKLIIEQYFVDEEELSKEHEMEIIRSNSAYQKYKVRFSLS